MQPLPNVYKAEIFCSLFIFWANFLQKKKVKNVGLDWCSPQLALSTTIIWHYVYQFDVWYNAGTLWSSANSTLKWLLWSEPAVPFQAVALTYMIFKRKAQWFECVSPQLPFLKVYVGRPSLVSPGNSFKCPLLLKGSTSGFVSLLKGLLCLALTCLVEYNNTLELSVTLFHPISFSHFHSTVVLLVNSHYSSWLRSAVSQTLQRWAFRSLIRELEALIYREK